MLGKVTDWASKNFDRTRTPAGPVPWEMHSGRPGNVHGRGKPFPRL